MIASRKCLISAMTRDFLKAFSIYYFQSLKRDDKLVEIHFKIFHVFSKQNHITIGVKKTSGRSFRFITTVTKGFF